MRRILLTQGKVALISDRDWPLVRKYKWYAHIDKNGRCYARTNVLRSVGRRPLSMHRLIMGAPACDIDHRDRNGLNNCRRNLRRATRSLNNGNSIRPKNNQSGVKGVSWYPRDKTWMAKIHFQGQQIYLGYYKRKKDAAQAYAKAAKKLFGAFARI